jgi:hypothetical protein
MAYSSEYLTRAQMSSGPSTGHNAQFGLDSATGLTYWMDNGGASGSNEAFTTIVTADYFLELTGSLKVGDVIFIYANDPTAAVVYVTAATAVTVTVTDLTT